MATKRISIRNSLAELLSAQLDGNNYPSNIYTNISTRSQFWDEVSDYPSLSIVNGRESTEYHPSLFTWKWLNIMIKVFTNEDDGGAQLEQLLSDLEDIIDANNSLEYETGETTEQISIISVETDEGLLAPFSVGEVSLLIQYQGNRLF